MAGSVTETGGKGFRRDIEGLRAIAVLLVLLFHAGVPGFHGGFVGVDVFFVLSGYLITLSLVREAESTGGIRFREFFARRFRRLLPAAALVLAVTAGAVRVALPETMWRDFAGDIIGAALYISNWIFVGRSVDYLSEDIVPSPVLHFWSLSIEEQYYAIWPLLIALGVLLSRRKSWRIRHTCLVVLLLLIVLPSFGYAQYRVAASPAAAFFDTGGRLWELGLGAVAALVPPPERWGPTLTSRLRAAALVVMLGAAFLVAPHAAWPGAAALLVVVPTAFLTWTRIDGTSLVDGLLIWRPMQWIGARSYSLYLWHWPPIAIAGAAVGGIEPRVAILITAASVLPAALSYRYVENPVRYATPLRRSPALSLAVGAHLTGAAVIAGMIVLLHSYSVASPDRGTDTASADSGDEETGVVPRSRGARDGGADGGSELIGVPHITPSPVDAASDVPRIYEDGCQVTHGTSTPEVCEYGQREGNLRIALVGDSKANQWASALIDLSERNGWSLASISKSACEFSLAMPIRQGEPFEDCLTWSTEVLSILRQGDFDLVLVSQGSNVAFSDGSGDGRLAIVEGMTEAYRRVEEAGSRVVILMDNHHPNLNIYECVARHRDDLRPCVFSRDESRGGRPAQWRAAAEGFGVIDMSDQVCPSPRCRPVIDGILAYRQGSHLTATLVDRLAPVLEARILEVVPQDPDRDVEGG